MTVNPVAMTSGSGFTISGAGSNVCTKNTTGAAWCYSNDSFTTTSAIVYKVPSNPDYTSSLTGDFYASLRLSGGASSSGNSYTVTHDDSTNTLNIEINQDESSDYANKYLGFNSTQTDPSASASGTVYIDNANYSAVRQSGSNVQSLSGTASSGDILEFVNLKTGSASSGGVLLPPPYSEVRF